MVEQKWFCDKRNGTQRREGTKHLSVYRCASVFHEKSEFVIPLLQGKSPVILHQTHGAVIVFILILLIPFLAAYIFFDGSFRLRETGQRKSLIDMLGHPHGIGLEILKLHLYQIAGRNAGLVGLVLVVKLRIDGKDVAFQLLRGDVFQF